MRKLNVLILFLLVVFTTYSQQEDSTSDLIDVTSDVLDVTDDVAEETVQEKTFYTSTLSSEDDPFAHYNPRQFWKTNNYQKQ